MSEARIVYKKGQAVFRVNARQTKTVAGVVSPQDLSALRLETVLKSEAATVVLTEGAGVTVTNALDGRFCWDVSAAQFATLASDSIQTTVNLYNADNSLFGETAMDVGYSL